VYFVAALALIFVFILLFKMKIDL